uniref:TSA: Wollemia nobilis Ref_Wollemi_Transcript_2333_2400 transcribed RNA sequence n=1 Tax=Wollemia nobilis TaxID=56998 RepID=A0A0C9RYT6_9CONI
MQYPGSNYYPVENPTLHPHPQPQPQPQPQAPASYNWASAPPYGESSIPAYYNSAPQDPIIPNHGSDPQNYGYNPPQTVPSSYPSSFPQYPSATPPQFTPQPSIAPTASSNYGYSNPTAPFYHSPPPNPVPTPGYEQGLPYSSAPESRGYGNRDSFQYPAFEQRYYETPVGKDAAYDNSGFDVDDGGFGGEVYAYDGGRKEPYGARGTGTGTITGSGSKPLTAFDDYGNLTKITKAVPKTETQDGGNGVQKFRVKILPDSGAQSSMDVLLQIGLDGLRMLDPSTSRTLRIYPLETITKWEVTDPSVYSFWAKSAVDIEPRRIRLQSNRYTTSTILDTVAAACVQFREMVDDRSNSYVDTNKTSEQATEKKKGSLADWVTLRKPAEEKQHWVPDEAATKCFSCGTDFGAFVRRHHCRNCGDVFCDKCTQGRVALTAEKDAQPVRVCDRCLAEVTQRLASAKEKSSKTTVQRSHDDLAKRLLEEMGKNRKANSESGGNSGSSTLWSSQSNSEGTGKRTREVACPTCTVHLQVQVPSSGTETVECGVCQHPFLVSAR